MVWASHTGSSRTERTVGFPQGQPLVVRFQRRLSDESDRRLGESEGVQCPLGTHSAGPKSTAFNVSVSEEDGCKFG